MTSLPSNLPALLLITVAPWTLERAARQARLSHAVVLGIIAASLCPGLVFAGSFASIAEPFASLTSYLYDALRVLPCMFVFAMLIVGPVANGIWREFTAHPTPTDRRRARLCVFLLLPLTLLLPALLWSAAVMIRPLPDPDFGIGTGKPAWIMSDFTRTIAAAVGSPVWLLIAPAIATVFALRIRRRMNSTPFPDEQRMCPACLYPLASLPPNSPCPECGTLSEP